MWLGAPDADMLRTSRAPRTPLRRVMGRWLPELPHRLVELRGEVEIVPGLRAIPAPGHTPGSYACVSSDVAFIGEPQ